MNSANLDERSGPRCRQERPIVAVQAPVIVQPNNTICQSILYKTIRPCRFNLGYRILLLKVASDRPFLGCLWASSVNVLWTFDLGCGHPPNFSEIGPQTAKK